MLCLNRAPGAPCSQHTTSQPRLSLKRYIGQMQMNRRARHSGTCYWALKPQGGQQGDAPTMPESLARSLVTAVTVSSLVLSWGPVPAALSEPIAASSPAATTTRTSQANEQQIPASLGVPQPLTSATPSDATPSLPQPSTNPSASSTADLAAISTTDAQPATDNSATTSNLTSAPAPAPAAVLPALPTPPSPPPSSALDTPTTDTSSIKSTTLSSPALSTLINEQEALVLPSPPSVYPELPSIKPPAFQEVFLSNGLKVKMLEDHEVPLVQGTLLMRGGTHASPPDKIGLATLSMATQRGGGSERYPGPELDLKLEQLAAGVETGAGAQGLTVDFYCATDDLAEVVGLWGDVLRHPALPDERLAFYQDQVLNRLEHKNDNPTVIARRELMKLMYGPSSIYARQPTVDGITSITIEDVKSFLSKWERPDTAVLGVVGDFKADQLIALLEAQLGSWGPAAGQPVAPPERIREADVLAPAAAAAGKVFVVDRPGLSQASVAMSEPGVSLMDPDAYALDLLSISFNSFGGELFDQLRSREGLAYSVFGSWDSPPDRQGVFVGGGETSSPGDFIVGLRRVLQQASDRAPSVETLEDARAQALNTFVFNFANSGAQLQRSLAYDLLGLPPDLLFRYRDGVARVTRDDVQGAARRHLHPDQQVTVVVGDALQVLPLLDAAGLQTTPLRLTD